ncbi:MAG: late competence protein [Candidatus Woesebacteria bacterium GW2011_GWA1_37_7]|uniref:Late competence protein n=1 Tax=Candidatus Woesebacteria bacterium GW2011_GWA1_37_7 TaxID=1618545 RepID=A0A0G0H3D5_9BACT|nr:MAG: late competence protein [Candidatus Woesebacteria bacterium GW2011_GWA1_37_7]
MQIRWKYLYLLLLLITATIWLAVLVYPDRNLKIIACDVGQGDGFLAIYGKTEILIDGGPNNNIVDCLSKYLPFWDRTIEIVLLTHPQKDHYMGLVEVFKRYKVKYFLANSLDSGSQEYSLLKSLVGGGTINVINPTRGMSMRVGLIHLDILHPSDEFLAENAEELKDLKTDNRKNDIRIAQLDYKGDVLGSSTSDKDPNIFSIVAILRYKDFDGLFTGDISPEVSDMIAQELMTNDKRLIEYIKIPHHGSKNGLTQNLLKAVDPELAVISAGKNNSYGHPHEEILKILRDQDIKILRTDQAGDVIIESSGDNYWVVP